MATDRLPLVQRIVLETVRLRGPLPGRELELLARAWLEDDDADVDAAAGELVALNLLTLHGDGRIAITEAGARTSVDQWG